MEMMIRHVGRRIPMTWKVAHRLNEDTAGLKFLYRKADEEAPPRFIPPGLDTEHLH
jgi:hypothetical protein